MASLRAQRFQEADQLSLGQPCCLPLAAVLRSCGWQRRAIPPQGSAALRKSRGGVMSPVDSRRRAEGGRRELERSVSPGGCSDCSFFSAEDGETPVVRRGGDNLRLSAGKSRLERNILRQFADAVEEEEGWVTYTRGEGKEVCSRLALGGHPGTERPMLMWRVSVLLRAPSPRVVFDVCMDTAGTPDWHSYCARVQENGGEHGALLVQSSFKGMFPISAREALEFRAAEAGQSEGDTHLVAFSSIGTPEVPVTPSHTRTYTTISGYRIGAGEEPGTVAFTMLTHVDAAGNLPDRLVNLAGSKGSLDFIRDLQKALDKLYA